MVRKHTKFTRKRRTRSRKSLRRSPRRVYRGGADKEYVAEIICNVEKEGDRLEKLKPLLEVFNITPSYYVDKTNVKDHPLYSKFSVKATPSERSLAINHIINLEKHKDTGKFVIMFESDVNLLTDIQTLRSELDNILIQ